MIYSVMVLFHPQVIKYYITLGFNEGKMGTTLESMLCQHIEEALMIDTSIYERDSSLDLDWADFPLKPGIHYQMFWFFKNIGSETNLSNIEIKVRNVKSDRISLCTGAFYLEERAHDQQ